MTPAVRISSCTISRMNRHLKCTPSGLHGIKSTSTARLLNFFLLRGFGLELVLKKCYLPDLPDATETVAYRGQTGLKVFLLKTYWSPQFTRKWWSSLFFKMLSNEAVTISFGKWFQLSHILFEKENLSISKLNLSI